MYQQQAYEALFWRRETTTYCKFHEIRKKHFGREK